MRARARRPGAIARRETLDEARTNESERAAPRSRRAIAAPGAVSVPEIPNGRILNEPWEKTTSRGHALRLDAVLEAVELPARVTGLDTGLADVDGDNLTHF